MIEIAAITALLTVGLLGAIAVSLRERA